MARNSISFTANNWYEHLNYADRNLAQGSHDDEPDDGQNGHLEDGADDVTLQRPAVQSFRDRLLVLFSRNKFHLLIIALVVIDALLVVTELVLDIQELQEQTKNHIAPEIIHFCSIGILSIFLVELAFKLYAYRRSFFKKKMEVFDAIVVLLSFILDIVSTQFEELMEITGFLIVLRLWRITRIMNSLVLSVKAQAEHKIQEQEKEAEKAIKERTEWYDYAVRLRREISQLRAMLELHQIADADKIPTAYLSMDMTAQLEAYSSCSMAGPDHVGWSSSQ